MISKQIYKRKSLMYFFPLLISFIIFLVPCSVKAEDTSPASSTKTIAHVFLDIEQPFGSDKKHYAFIDRLISIAKDKIATKKDYTTEEAVKRLMTIQKILKDEGLVFKQNFLLSKGIETKAMDCDNFCALFVAMSEAVGLPVIPVYAPNHSFLRFNFNDNSYLNWEPLEATNLPDSYYIKNMNISQQSLQQGVYLKSLTRNEFIGVEYNNIGSYLITRKQFRNSIAYLNKAIELYPKFSSAYHNRGSVLYALRDIDRALADLTTAVKLDPYRPGTHNTLGDIYFDRKDYSRAIDEYKESIRLDPSNHVPYYSLGLVLQTLGKKTEAQKWLDKSREVKNKYSR